MKHLHVKVTLVVALSVAASLLVSWALTAAIGLVMPIYALGIAIACPIIVATPVSYAFLLQSHRLRRVNEKLNTAHVRLAEAYRSLEENSRRDRLTGLINRETFLKMIRSGRRRSDSGFLFIVDADHFKHINDNHGHLTGDRALKAIAQAISSSVRENDAAARIGGEEFAVFLPGASLAEAIAVSERICRSIEHLDFASDAGERINLTVSIGGTEYVDNLSVNRVLRKADRFLYQAKNSGRNRAIVVPELARAA